MEDVFLGVDYGAQALSISAIFLLACRGFSVAIPHGSVVMDALNEGC